ncbi:4a-hydroxytetrahydrobiopterin dehydratase [Hamadaea sp. NPDC051192]|uniref:4a-hydroxytetrahydrobiopterin dehydratase n=1 Tax=Hamadaea sp. NPDC051192 TaxID=3154940 RepID=UPI003445DCCE
MGAVWRRDQTDYLTDALSQLTGWTRDLRGLRRTLTLDDSQHRELAEHITVYADAAEVRAQVRRLDGHTQIQLCTPDSGTLTPNEVSLAARIEAAYGEITNR